MPEVRNAVISARVLIQAEELERIERYPGEHLDEARARLIRSKLREVGIPVAARVGVEVTVTAGYLLQRRDSKTGNLAFTWRAR